jgi:hypothetical protein
VGGGKGQVWKVRVKAVGFKQGTWVDWEFATMSKASVFQVRGFFSLTAQGVMPGYINYLCGCIKYKNRILCVQVKNKPCMVYTVMHLIPCKQFHGSETLTKCCLHLMVLRTVSKCDRIPTRGKADWRRLLQSAYIRKPQTCIRMVVYRLPVHLCIT